MRLDLPWQQRGCNATASPKFPTHAAALIEDELELAEKMLRGSEEGVSPIVEERRSELGGPAATCLAIVPERGA